MLDLPFAVQEGDSGVTQNSREMLLNMYAEPEGSGRSRLVRRQRPGLTLQSAQADYKRGIARFEHGHYFVARDKFFKWDGTTLSQIGTISTSIGDVTMITDDNDNVLLSDGATGYHWDGVSLTTVTAPSDIGTLDTLDGYGIYNKPNSDRWYISALNDLTSWDALDFATAESSPDPIVRVFVDRDEIWLFGSKTIEVWRNSGALDFPFTPSTTLQRGCLAAYSVASDDNTLFWLGDDKIVYRADGYRPARVSTHAIEDMIEGATTTSTARAFIYTVRGHKFYTLTFPGYKTLQFNIATGLWNVAETWGFDYWNVIGGAGRAVDYYLDGSGVVTLDSSKNTDSGTKMERGGISAPVHNNGDRFSLKAFWLDAEMGRGANGEVMLQVSRNGEEFGNVTTRFLGALGNYRKRAMWRKLGRAREFSLKVTMTDDVSFAIMGTGGIVA